MSIPTVSYEEFSTLNQTSNQGVVQNGGPWVVLSDVSTNAQNTTGCAAESTSWCEGYCLTCHVEPLNPPPAYQGTFITNISVNLADYGGATSLDFTWNYWPAYCGGATGQGAGIPITSQVGDATFEEQFPALSFDAFFHATTGGHQWDIADKITHNGSTTLVRGSDPNLGYIAIKINATMAYSATNHEEYLYFYVKAIGFLITTPTLSATTPSSSSTSSSTSSAPAGVVAGAVIGALAFVVLLILAICLFRRRRKKGTNPVDGTVFTQQANHEAPTPMGEGPFPPSHLVTSHSAQPTSSASLRPASVFSHGSYGSYGPPPIYSPDGSTRQGTMPLTPSSPELARFAAANREVINENLEARLQAAGYLPTEDPSRLTPEEWRDEYGITILELRRLQNLYAQSQQSSAAMRSLWGKNAPIGLYNHSLSGYPHGTLSTREP